MISRISVLLTSAPTMRRLTWLLLASILAVYGAWISYVILADRPLDFYIYLIAAETFARGGDPYTITTPQLDALAAEMGITNYAPAYLYPPHTALLLLPMLSIKSQWAALTWSILNALAMVGGAWYLASLFAIPYSRPVALALMLLLVPPLATLLAGQVVGLLYFCTVLGLVWLKQARDIRAGAALAAGALLKLLPLALILYLFWRKQWRTGFVAVLLLFLLLVLVIPLSGFNGMQNYLLRAVALGDPNGVNSAPFNQTLTGFVGRSFVGLGLDQLLLARILGLLMVLATVTICLPLGKFEDFLVHEYALIVAAIHMVAPFTWYLQLVMIHIPLFFVAMLLIAKRQAVLLVVLLVLVFAADIHGLFWHQITEMVGNGWWMSMPLLLTLTLWSILAVDIVTSKLAIMRQLQKIAARNTSSAL